MYTSPPLPDPECTEEKDEKLRIRALLRFLEFHSHVDRERETPEVAPVFHKLEFEKYAWLALVNKALVIWNKWELSPTHVICVFLPPRWGLHSASLGGMFPVIGFVNLKGKTVGQVQSILSGCGHAKPKAWIKLARKEADLGD